MHVVRNLVVGLAVLGCTPALAQDGESFEPCGSASQMLESAKSEMAEFDAAGAEASLAQALVRWGCNERATPQQITEYFLLQVAVSLLGQKTDRLNGQYLAARQAAEASRVDLNTAIQPVVQLDPMAAVAYDSAQSPGTTHVEFVGYPAGWSAYISGAPHIAGPYPQARYLVQVLDEQGRSRWAQEVVVEGREQIIVLPTDRVPPALRGTSSVQARPKKRRDATRSDAADAVSAREDGERRKPKAEPSRSPKAQKRPGWLDDGLVWTVGGSVGLATGIGLTAGTFAQARSVPKTRLDESGSPETNPKATGLIVGNTIGWGLMGAGAAALTYGLVTKLGKRTGLADVGHRPGVHTVRIGPGFLGIDGAFR